MRILFLLALAVLVVVVAWKVRKSSGSTIAIGDAVDVQFENPFLFGEEVGSLASLRGKPLYILNWGLL